MVAGKPRRSLLREGTAAGNLKPDLRTRQATLLSNMRATATPGADLRRSLSRTPFASHTKGVGKPAPDLRYTMPAKLRSKSGASSTLAAAAAAPQKILVSKDLKSKRAEYLRVPQTFSAEPITITIRNDFVRQQRFPRKNQAPRTPDPAFQRPPEKSAPFYADPQSTRAANAMFDVAAHTLLSNIQNRAPPPTRLPLFDRSQPSLEHLVAATTQTRRVGTGFDNSTTIRTYSEHKNQHQHPHHHQQQQQQQHAALHSFANLGQSAAIMQQQQLQNRMQDQQPTTSVIRVSNLHRGTTIDDLRSAFSVFGPIEDVFLLPSASGSSSGVALIAFPNKTCCQNAINEYDDELIDGLVVKIEHYTLPGDNMRLGLAAASAPPKRAGFLGASILPATGY